MKLEGRADGKGTLEKGVVLKVATHATAGSEASIAGRVHPVGNTKLTNCFMILHSVTCTVDRIMFGPVWDQVQ